MDLFIITAAIGAVGTVTGAILVAVGSANREALAGENVALAEKLKFMTEDRDAQSADLGRALIARNAARTRVDVLERENEALAEGILKAKGERDEFRNELNRRRAIAREASVKGHAVQSARAAAARALKGSGAVVAAKKGG